MGLGRVTFVGEGPPKSKGYRRVGEMVKGVLKAIHGKRRVTQARMEVLGSCMRLVET